MKRLLSLTFFLAWFCLTHAQTIDAYAHLRRQYGISQCVGVQALETLVGSRVVEVKGTVKGSVQVANGATSLLLEKSDGDTMFVTCVGAAPDWLMGNEIAVRLIVNAHRSAPKDELRAKLIAAAPEGDVEALEASAPSHRALYSSRHTSRGFARTSAYTLPASDATPIYARFIQSRNRRLSGDEATRIAQGVIGYSLKYGVDARLIMAMVMVESGFNPNATSRTGAMGLGQLMPGTAAGMGVSNAYDSIDNLYGTVRLIRNHLENYERQTGDDYQSLVLSLAAYNAGPGAVSKHGGVPPYRETQNYVRKVIGIYRALCGA